MATSPKVDHIEQLVTPLLVAHGLSLYDVELAGPALRVLVDGPHGVDLGVLSQVSTELSTALDRADPIPDRYTLEVSSPGLERPLRRPWHFAAAVGRRARLKTRPGQAGERRIEGEVVGADDDAVTVAVGPDLEQRRVPYDQIERAQVVFDWGPSADSGRSKPKPGTRRPARKANAT
ncbi:MAG: ribosome maturation factor RimP [Actinobacteria bacterium]|nr:ribosome maturation factor RimP [Actinomycetota bacterium]